MALHLDRIAPKARAMLIKVGRAFGSTDTLAQAEQTLSALQKYQAKVLPMGFGIEDAERLTDAQQALIDAGVGREQARAGKKQTNKALAAAITEGKSKRLRARAVLSSVRSVLAEEGSEDAVHAIDVGHQQVATAEDNAAQLATQLTSLKTVLERADIVKAAKKRGGPEITAALVANAATLRELSKDAATPPGTPEETDRLDLIDGIIVGLARNARRAAARELGEPAIATAFELTKLYGPARAKRATAEPPLEEPLAGGVPVAGGVKDWPKGAAGA